MRSLSTGHAHECLKYANNGDFGDISDCESLASSAVETAAVC